MTLLSLKGCLRLNRGGYSVVLEIPELSICVGRLGCGGVSA